MKFNFLIAVFTLFAFSGVIQAEVINDSIPSGKNFDKAIFRLWYPDNVNTLAGIIVLMPGHNGDGRNAVNDSSWQKLAQKFHFALLGCYFSDYKGKDFNYDRYSNVREGSGQALLDVIDHFSTMSGHKELSKAPLLLWGHSAGGQFNYEFVCWKPERVIAFVVNKGGFYSTALATPATREVPGIFFIGERDLEFRKNIVKGIFLMNRRVGAIWTFAEEPGLGHELGQTKKLAYNYFNEIIPLRISNPLITDSIGILKRIPANSGFIGDITTHDYKNFAEVLKDNNSTAWLPNERFAKNWIAFIKNKPFYGTD